MRSGVWIGGRGACYWVLKARVMSTIFVVGVGWSFGQGIVALCHGFLYRPYVENYTVDASIFNNKLLFVVVYVSLVSALALLGLVWLLNDSLDNLLM